MKRLILISLIGVLSCTHNELEDNTLSDLAANQLAARFAGNTTKVVMDSQYALSWEKGDQVSVYVDGDNHCFSALSSGKETVLEGQIELDSGISCYASYPYLETNTINDNIITTNIPPVQEPRQGSFPVNYAVARASGKILKFYNLCGLVGFEITEDDIASVTVSPNRKGEFMTGKIEVDCSDIQSPSYSVIEGIADVTLVAETTFEKGPHYVAVLPQTFDDGISVTMYKKDGTQVKRTTTIGFTLDRSHRVETGQIDAGQDWSNTVLITSAGELQGFLATAEELGPETEVRLINDIDLKGYELASAKSFAGKFKGNSNSIINWNTKTALFETLASTAVVEDLVIDESCALEVQPTGDAAFIALDNQGLITNCINNGAVTTVNEQFTSTSARSIGTIAAVSSGSIVSCVNNSPLTFSPSGINMAATQYIGGVVGQAYASTGNNAMERCVNNGKLSIVPVGFSCRLFIGGVCGGTPAVPTMQDGAEFGNYGAFVSCRNTADVEFVCSGQSKKTTYINMGGVLGYAEASITDCDNSGGLDVRLNSSASSVKHVHQRPAIGGVAGTVLYNVTGCDNTGPVNVSGTFGEALPEMYESDSDQDGTGVGIGQFRQASFAGVVAIAGNGAGTSISDCKSSAGITLNLNMHEDGVAQACAGGVVGYAAASVTNCSFNAAGGLDVSSTMHASHVGGVVGLVSETSAMNSCINSSAISYDFVKESASGNCSAYANVGGVVGYLSLATAVDGIIYSSSTGAMSVVNGYYSSDYVTCVGGLVGKSAVSRILGSSEAGSKHIIKGKMTVNTPAKVYVGGIAGSLGGENQASKGFFAFARQDAVSVVKPGAGSRIGGICGYRYSAQNDGAVNLQSRISVDCTSGSNVFVGQYYGEYLADSSYQIHSSTINSPDFNAPNAAACGIAVGKLTKGTLQLGKSSNPFTIRPNLFNGNYFTVAISASELTAKLVGLNSGTLKQTNVVISDLAQAESGTMPKWRSGYLDIHFINTGTGECSFIIMPDGTQMLVDMASENTGPDDVMSIDGTEMNVFVPRVPNDTKRPSEWINMYLAKCMAWTGNERLDFISVTHMHGDHIGSRTSTDRVDGLGGSSTPSGLNSGGYQKIGAAEILDDNKVGVLVDNGYPDYDYPLPLAESHSSNLVKNYRNAAAYHARNSGMIREEFKVGVNNQFVMKYSPADYPDFEIRNIASGGCVWTGSGTSHVMKFPTNAQLTVSSDTSLDSPNENMTSSVFRLTYGKFNYYAGGDLVSNNPSKFSIYPWRDAEAPVADVVGEVEVMKANHHGSVDGNTQYMLDKLHPQAIIVNAWRTVQPRVSTYERLKASDADLFTTSMDSSYATGYSDAGKSFSSKEGHYIVRVNPGGHTYYIYSIDDKDTEMSMKILKRFGPYVSR